MAEIESTSEIAGDLQTAITFVEGNPDDQMANKVCRTLQDLAELFAKSNNQSCPAVKISFGDETVSGVLVWTTPDAVDKLASYEGPNQIEIKIEHVWQPSGFIETLEGNMYRVGPTGETP